MIREIIKRGLNNNQVILLKELRLNTYKSLSSALRNLSRKHGIPLSTLKANAKVLRDLNLINVSNGNGVKEVVLTPMGHFVIELLNSTAIKDFTVDLDVIKVLTERSEIVRRHVLEMVAEAGSGHVGASLSVVDILVTLLTAKMRYDFKNPKWHLRDRLILSKGHAAPALYAVLATTGIIPRDELRKFRDIEGILQGHPDTEIPGVDMVSGSLGQGLSIGCGMALALKNDGIPAKVYVIMGDGELDEGQVWEAAMTASKLRLDNLIVIIDRNKYQQEGLTEAVKPLEPLVMKWISFGWHVIEVDGHNFRELLGAFNEADEHKGGPTAIIAHTVKGRGFPPAEGNNKYHSRPITKEELRLTGVI
ncbi:MAG: transketolase [Sulfolobales archaeon]|nr:transketolase [Sulfolobales archaeon]MCX8186007.1 transketolase [Sulfolobales archaeon]MDW7969264.1 transketolase [Sulfolobales archaeon]